MVDVAAVEELVERAARARASFADYLRFVHSWEPREHQWPWIRALQALAEGRLRTAGGEPTVKLAIEAFPGSGKSGIISRWCCWMLGNITLRGETPQAGYVSYSDDVAQLRSVAIRDTIEFNKEYREYVFPTARPWKEKGWGQKEWFLWRDDPSNEFPTLRAAGFSGAILSYRFTHFVIIDDPHDPVNVRTVGQRDETWRLWRTTVRTRATQGVTPIVGIWTRWAEDDLAGRLKAVEGDWVVLHTPALNEFEESAWPPEIIDGAPVGVSTETLLKLRQEDHLSFLTQYQALPPSEEGDLFHGIPTGPRPVLQDVLKIIQFWDTATTQKTSSDFNAMVELWKLKNGRTFINKVVNVKKSPAQVIDIIIDQYHLAEQAGLTPLVCIENASAGPAFVDWVWAKAGLRMKLHHLGGHGPGTGQRGNRDLGSRAIAVSRYLETGIVYWADRWESWKDDFLAQLKSFTLRGHAAHDDMLAALVGAVEELYPNRRTGRPQPMQARYVGW